MHKDLAKILISHQEIVDKCKELGKAISKDYADKSPVFVSLLKGAVPFLAELIKCCDIDNMEIDFMDVSSYVGTQTTHSIRILKDLDRDINGLDVVLVEDIVDTGHTLKKVVKMIKDKGANSVKVVSLLNKPERREIEIEADYVGFTIPNEFVVGFGLDYNEKYRQLPYIGVLKNEIYS